MLVVREVAVDTRFRPRLKKELPNTRKATPLTRQLNIELSAIHLNLSSSMNLHESTTMAVSGKQ